jgi:hypothetical protein
VEYGRRGRMGLALCALALLSPGACHPTSGPGTAPSPPAKQVCSRSAILEPSCGVLWGVTTQQPSLESVATTEGEVGRRFDMVYRFHQIDDALPTQDERRVVASGRTLHISLDTNASWTAIASGSHDAALRRAAVGIASLGAPVFVTFGHEANNPEKASLGDPAQFAEAWRHVHEVFDQVNVTNAVWVWVMMGSPDTLAGVGRFWPGNRYVDWISWDVYNQSGCLAGGIDPARYESFLAGVLPFYTWVRSQGSRAGIDPDKPMMISEAGSVIYPHNAALTARWYAEIPAALARYPQIQALGLWDHTGNRLCDYRFADDTAVTAAVAAAGRARSITGALQ